MSILTNYYEEIKSQILDLDDFTLKCLTSGAVATVSALASLALGNPGAAAPCFCAGILSITAIAANSCSHSGQQRIRDITDTPYIKATPEEIMLNEKAICKESGENEKAKTHTIDRNEARILGVDFGVESIPTPLPENIHIFESKGGRTYMEDKALFGEITKNGSKIQFFGVLDGHGENGASIVTLICERLPAVLEQKFPDKNNEELTTSDIYEAIRATYKELNEEIKELSATSGTTAAIAVIIGNNTYVANVGDSRILLLKKDGTYIQCTDDAKVVEDKGVPNSNLTRFAKKIRRNRTLRSRLFSTDSPLDLKRGRLSSPLPNFITGIEPASTMGDHATSPQALLEPKISGPYELQPGDFLLSGTDGIWDHLTSHEVNELRKGLAPHEIPAATAQTCMGLASKCYKTREEVDNTTVAIFINEI